MGIIALFAGSFCPFTKGHEDIVKKVVPLCDRLYIAIGQNAQKDDLFSLEQRLTWIRQLYAGHPKFEITSYQGLTTDFCRQIGAHYLIRGIRNAADYNLEQEIFLINRQLNPDTVTLFIPASPQWAAVSSSFVRELWSLHADYSPYVSYKLPEI